MKKESTPFSFDPIAESYIERATLYQNSIAFLSATELDLFNVIGYESLTADGIAHKLGIPISGLTRLLNVLVALNFLRKDGAHYSNNATGLNYLVRGSPNYIGNFRLFRIVFEKWLNLTKSIKDGKPPESFDLRKLPAEDIDSILSFMNWRANRQAPEFIKFLDLSRVMHVLDLGCGPGTFGMEILKYNINIDLTLFDYPEIIEYTRKFIERKGFNGLVHTIEGDFLKDDIGKNYDMVIISNVLRLYSFNDCLRILNKAFDSLKHKGKVVVQELLLDTTRISPSFSALHSLELFLTTSNGDLLTEPEVTLLLKEAWFSDIQKFITNYGTTIFIGTK
ncbi:MAG: methyltransferase [Candidatus Kapaibacteriales bacterium]